MPRTYVDNAMNRRLGRVGMARGSMPVSRSGIPLPPKTYADNAYNRRLGRDGLTHGAMVITKEDRYSIPTATSKEQDIPWLFNSYRKEHESSYISDDSGIGNSFSSPFGSPERSNDSGIENISSSHFGSPQNTQFGSRSPFDSSRKEQLEFQRKTSGRYNTVFGSHSISHDHLTTQTSTKIAEYAKWFHQKIKKEEEQMQSKHEMQWDDVTMANENVMLQLQKLQLEEIEEWTEFKNIIKKETNELENEDDIEDISILKQRLNRKIDEFKVSQHEKWAKWITKTEKDEQETKEKEFWENACNGHDKNSFDVEHHLQISEYNEWTRRKKREYEEGIRRKHESQWEELNFTNEALIGELLQLQGEESERWIKWKYKIEMEREDIFNITRLEDLTLKKKHFVKELKELTLKEKAIWKQFKSKADKDLQYNREREVFEVPLPQANNHSLDNLQGSFKLTDKSSSREHREGIQNIEVAAPLNLMSAGENVTTNNKKSSLSSGNDRPKQDIYCVERGFDVPLESSFNFLSVDGVKMSHGNNMQERRYEVPNTFLKEYPTGMDQISNEKYYEEDIDSTRRLPRSKQRSILQADVSSSFEKEENRFPRRKSVLRNQTVGQKTQSDMTDRNFLNLRHSNKINVSGLKDGPPTSNYYSKNLFRKDHKTIHSKVSQSPRLFPHSKPSLESKQEHGFSSLGGSFQDINHKKDKSYLTPERTIKPNDFRQGRIIFSQNTENSKSKRKTVNLSSDKHSPQDNQANPSCVQNEQNVRDLRVYLYIGGCLIMLLFLDEFVFDIMSTTNIFVMFVFIASFYTLHKAHSKTL